VKAHRLVVVVRPPVTDDRAAVLAVKVPALSRTKFTFKVAGGPPEPVSLVSLKPSCHRAATPVYAVVPAVGPTRISLNV